MMIATKFSATVLLMAALATNVHGHGQMTSPKPRPVTAKYRADCYGGLKGAGDDELQWAPVENLIQRKQADQPYAKTFDVMNGCRGMIYEAENPVTALTTGKEFTIEYYIQAPHPGYLEVAIVKPKTDADGKITYEREGEAFKKVENFATNSDGKSLTATIPTTITGCDKAGDCALQFYWHSDIANQTYPTCADITLTGGSGGSSASTPVSTPSASGSGDEDNDAATPATTAPAAETTTAPATTTAPSSDTASNAGSDAASDAASGSASEAASTPSPTSASTPSPTKKVCTPKRFRRRD